MPEQKCEVSTDKLGELIDRLEQSRLTSREVLEVLKTLNKPMHYEFSLVQEVGCRCGQDCGQRSACPIPRSERRPAASVLASRPER